jgi:hypothetical protein
MSRNEFPRGFICLFHRVMPDSMVIGKGIILNVIYQLKYLTVMKLVNQASTGA